MVFNLPSFNSLLHLPNDNSFFTLTKLQFSRRFRRYPKDNQGEQRQKGAWKNQDKCVESHLSFQGKMECDVRVGFVRAACVVFNISYCVIICMSKSNKSVNGEKIINSVMCFDTQLLKYAYVGLCGRVVKGSSYDWWVVSPGQTP